MAKKERDEQSLLQLENAIYSAWHASADSLMTAFAHLVHLILDGGEEGDCMCACVCVCVYGGNSLSDRVCVCSLLFFTLQERTLTMCTARLASLHSWQPLRVAKALWSRTFCGWGLVAPRRDPMDGQLRTLRNALITTPHTHNWPSGAWMLWQIKSSRWGVSGLWWMRRGLF